MVTIDKENNELKLSKSQHVEDDRMDSIQGCKISTESMFSFDYKIFGKTIKPSIQVIKQK